MERTKYMTRILNETYPNVAIEAIKGGFDGAWERLIVERLYKDYTEGHSEAECIVESVEGEFDMIKDHLYAAAKMITSSKIPEPINN